jgi:hypothetical protein
MDNSPSMDLGWAAKLLNYLSEDDRWHCDGGWCDLTDAYTEAKVTPGSGSLSFPQGGGTNLTGA